MTRARDIKKSNFTAITSLQTTDYLDLVRNGQNFKISIADFLTSLGVTGTLQTKGEITSIPVLDVDADINYIRNIGGGPGVLVTESPQDGIEIEHNFTIDKSGAAVIINENADSPTVRSIVAGTGISVGASGTEIQITNTDVPASSKTVFVYEEADFPTPAGGVITLEADTEYYLLNDISTVNRFALGNNTVLSAGDGFLVTLTYSGTGTMFTGVDVNFNLKNITIACAAGTWIDLSSTTGAHEFICTGVTVNCDTLGTVDELALTFFREVNVTAADAGLSFSGSCYTFLYAIGTIIVNGVAAKAIDFGTATFTIITMNSLLFSLDDAGAYCISGLVNDGNVNSNGHGTVFNCVKLATGTFLENISHYDNRWDFLINTGASNSYSLALATHGGADAVIAAANTPVIIPPTWTAQTMHRFTQAGAGVGRWTYDGKERHFDINISISGQRAAAGTDTFAFYLYLTGYR